MGGTEPDQNSGQLKLKGGRGETMAWEVLLGKAEMPCNASLSSLLLERATVNVTPSQQLQISRFKLQLSGRRRLWATEASLPGQMQTA